MSDIRTPQEIGRLYKDGQITLNQSEKLRDLWSDLSEKEKNSIIKQTNGSNAVRPEMTDREIQEKILRSLQNIRISNNSIKGWLTFFGVLQIIGIIGLIIFLVSA